MATLYVSEFTQRDAGNNFRTGQDAAIAPSAVDQTVTFTSSSVQSAAFGAQTRLVRLVSSVAACVAFGTNPTATASKLYLPAGVPEYFVVRPATKVAVIQAS